MTLIFDIESNGLLHDVTRIHCIGIYDTETKQTLVYNDEGDTEPILLVAYSALKTLNLLLAIISSIMMFAVIRKLFPWFERSGLVLDTLVLSRICHADILKTDQKRKWKGMPLQLYGRHSLESYGYRLGEHKGEFGKGTDWKEWSREMQDYMIQDVVVTTKLWNHFQPYLNGSR
jgi:hypothetical protein